MHWLPVIAIAGVSLFGLAYLYVNIPPARLAKSLKWSLLGILGLVFAVLAATGKLGMALLALTAAMPWLGRALRGYLLARAAQQAFRGFSGAGFGPGFAGAARDKQPGGASEVTARFLAMRLDHDSGELSGSIREGRFAGRTLADLTEAEAQDFHAECAADPDSLRLYEGWLDRTHPDWRARFANAEDASPGGADRSGMPTTRADALSILGLGEDAGPEDIRAAYRTLMAKLHPDRGGSTFLAAKLNAARDLLLRDR